MQMTNGSDSIFDNDATAAFDKYFFFSNVGNIPPGNYVLKVEVRDGERCVNSHYYNFMVCYMMIIFCV